MYHTGISKGTHHKGPRQAGNKSLISFRAGHGLFHCVLGVFFRLMYDSFPRCALSTQAFAGIMVSFLARRRYLFQPRMVLHRELRRPRTRSAVRQGGNFRNQQTLYQCIKHRYRTLLLPKGDPLQRRSFHRPRVQLALQMRTFRPRFATFPCCSCIWKGCGGRKISCAWRKINHPWV